MSRSSQFYLLIVVVSAGCGLAVEITAGRLIAPYLGMSLYTWTAIIAVVLAGFSLGHWIGGEIAEGPAGTVRRRVAWALCLAGLTTLASPVLLRLMSDPILGAGLPHVAAILVLTSALFFLPSLFVGIPSPALAKLAIEENPARLGPVLGLFYAGGAVGSIAGTLMTGYVFISWLGSVRTLILISGLYGAMGVGLLLFRRKGEAPAAARLSLLTLGALAAGIAVIGQAVAAFVGNCDRESDYYCIRIVDVSAETGAQARLMVLDHLGHGTNLRDAPQRLVTPYVDMQDMLARIHSGRRTPFRVFFIGGGGYSLPRAWLDARPDAEVTVAEIDPAVTAAAIETMWLEPDPRLTLAHQDARRALAERQPGQFDVIVGDAFHDIAVPHHLVTLEFFALVRSRLAEDGIYLMNVVDSRARPRLALSVAMTLGAVFDRVEVWMLEPPATRTTFVIAGLGEATPHDRLPLRQAPGQSFVKMPDGMRRDLSAELRPILLTDDYAPVDRLIGVN